MKKTNYFTCSKNELERINEGLQHRNVDADSIISIIDDDTFVTVWYKTK